MTLFIKRLKNFYKYKDLLRELVSRDLKIKYRRSFLGYLWSVLDPLLMMLVMSFVFSDMFKRDIPNYPVYLITGQLMFNFMKISTNKCVYSIVNNSPLIKKVYLPKYIFPLSSVTSCLVDLFLSLIALLAVMIFTGAQFTWYLLLTPIPILQLYAFSLGLGLALGALNVFFRDIQYIYTVVTTVWMYLTPIFYSINDMQSLMWFERTFNPMYHYVGQFRDLALYGRMMSLDQSVYGICAAVGMLVLGTVVFTKLQDKYILYI